MALDQARLDAIEAEAEKRVLIMDGAWGTEFQRMGLADGDYESEAVAHATERLKGNHDVLNLTAPKHVRAVHRAYFDAGADFAATNTFSATTIAQGDYGLEDMADELAAEGARIAREIADEYERITGEPKLVLGAMGPTNKTLSLSPDVNNPGYRDVTFDDVYRAYKRQAAAMAPHMDMFLIETIFDTLNAKAAIKAVSDYMEESGHRRPILLSGTITDASGRTLSGQTTEAFWHSVRHARPWAVGLNCALGAGDLRQYVATLAKVADTRVLAYPNAGLPNEFGAYDETPEQTAGHLQEWAGSKLVNLVGGCCGTTQDHIRAIAEGVKGATPRPMGSNEPVLRLSGLEPFQLVG